MNAGEPAAEPLQAIQDSARTLARSLSSFFMPDAATTVKEEEEQQPDRQQEEQISATRLQAAARGQSVRKAQQEKEKERKNAKREEAKAKAALNVTDIAPASANAPPGQKSFRGQLSHRAQLSYRASKSAVKAVAGTPRAIAKGISSGLAEVGEFLLEIVEEPPPSKGLKNLALSKEADDRMFEKHFAEIQDNREAKKQLSA
jgi:hypothetical protein